MSICRAGAVIMGLGLCGLTNQVSAQEAEATSAAPSNADIIVTGSRLAKSTFETPTPITTLSQAALEAKAPTTVSDLIRDIPSLRPNQNNQQATDVGASTFNMRSLGASRTLVLIDGRRAMDTSPTGGFDMNILPAPLIQRVEIVTAGASSVYGSDAVTGVVNVFLDSKLKGLKLDLQQTITARGDNPTYSASAAYGAEFAGGRGHIVAAATLFRNPDMLRAGTRKWGREGWTLITNPTAATNGLPLRLIVPDARLSQMTLGGVITSNGPLKNIQFGENAAQSIFRQGTNVGSVWMQGGDGVMTQPYFAILQPETKRENAFARATYEFSPALTGYAEVLYARSRNRLINIYNNNNADIVIRQDNAFLPTNIRDIMVANNIATFNMGRLNPETGINDNSTKYNYLRASSGLNGELWNAWKWDAHVDYTRAIYNNRSKNNRIQANWTRALDSVIGPSGTPICRSTLTNPNNGCVPANPFGLNSVSPAAVAYVTGTSWMKGVGEGVDVAANVTGQLVNLPAGPVELAIGAEYRRETLDFTSDPISAINGWRQASSAPYSGKVVVKEAYAETSIPIFRDAPFADRLDLDLAGRVVDYSTSGFAAVWKVGVNWSINDQIRFRGTYSKDFRAPKINELFAAATVRSGLTVIDPLTNNSVVTQIRTGGNPNLEPEQAHTLTAGIVLRPHFVSRLQLSVDAFDIRLKDAITGLGFQEVVNLCAAGVQTFCGSVFRDGTGKITLIEQVSFNAQVLKTRGIDFEANYSVPVGSGNLAFGLVGTYVDKLISQVTGAALDTAGQLTGTLATPKWRWSASATYQNGPFTGRALVNYIGAGKYDNRFGSRDINRNKYPAYAYLDLSAQYKVTDVLEFYLKVENVLDTDPPLLATDTIIRAQPAGASTFYDQIGRNFGIGMRIRL